MRAHQNPANYRIDGELNHPNLMILLHCLIAYSYNCDFTTIADNDKLPVRGPVTVGVSMMWKIFILLLLYCVVLPRHLAIILFH